MWRFCLPPMVAEKVSLNGSLLLCSFGIAINSSTAIYKTYTENSLWSLEALALCLVAHKKSGHWTWMVWRQCLSPRSESHCFGGDLSVFYHLTHRLVPAHPATPYARKIYLLRQCLSFLVYKMERFGKYAFGYKIRWFTLVLWMRGSYAYYKLFFKYFFSSVRTYL